MKRFVLALAALLMGASPALADTTRYVDAVNGNDSYDGTAATHTIGTSNGPWQHVSHSNTGAGGSSSVHLPQANTANGNVVLMIAPGTYPSMFKPDSIATDWKRYFLMGNIANPAATIINTGGSVAISDSSISIHGVTLDHGLSIGRYAPETAVTAKYDSVLDCVIQQGDFSTSLSYHCVLARCSFPQAKLLRIGYDSDNSATSLRKTVGFQMHDCTFPALWSNSVNPVDVGIADDATYTKRQLVDSLLWRNCTLNVNVAQSGTDPEAFRFYYAPHVTLDHCHITIHQNNTTDNESKWLFAFRDSSLGFVLNADTIRCDGAGKQSIFMSHNGNIGQSVSGGVVDSCLFSGTNTEEPLFRYKDGMRQATVTYSTFITPGPYAFYVDGDVTGPNDIEHNTFIAHSAPSKWVRGIVRFAQDDGNGSFLTDTTKFYSNLIYNDYPSFRSPFFDTQVDNDQHSTACGLFVPINRTGVVNFFKSEWNAYQYLPYKDSYKDRSIGWCCYGNSAPGASNTYKNNFPALHRVADSLSVFGDLKLAYGTSLHFAEQDTFLYSLPISDQTLDPHIGGGSVARGMAKDSTDAGAVAYDSSPTAIMSGPSASIVRLPYRYSGTIAADSLFAITNAGAGTMTVSIAVSGFASSGFTFTPSSYSLTQNQKKTFSLSWASPYPTPANPGTTTIILTTNDPALPAIRIPVAFDDAISHGEQ